MTSTHRSSMWSIVNTHKSSHQLMLHTNRGALEGMTVCIVLFHQRTVMCFHLRLHSVTEKRNTMSPPIKNAPIKTSQVDINNVLFALKPSLCSLTAILLVCKPFPETQYGIARVQPAHSRYSTDEAPFEVRLRWIQQRTRFGERTIRAETERAAVERETNRERDRERERERETEREREQREGSLREREK